MKFNSILRSVALVAALASTVPLLAKPISKTINIAQSAKIGKADLQAGEYRLLIDEIKRPSRRDVRPSRKAKGDGKTAPRNPRWIPCSSAKTAR
jgi:hypothetical protein